MSNTEKPTIESLARQVYDASTITADYRHMPSGAPEWAYDVWAAGQNRMDAIESEYIHDALSDIANGYTDGDHIEADIYNADLTAWLASSLDRFGDAERALQELGDGTTIAAAIQWAQAEEKRRAFDAVYAALEERLEELEDAEEEEEEEG